MNRIKKKLRSQTGASLTFALLLFLVCAVVGSAVLVAGTAAAGRMSKIAEMDQRYYSVNSAARLLIELIEKDEIWYEKESEDDQSGSEGGGEGSDEGSDEGNDEPSEDEEPAEINYTLYIGSDKVGDTETSLAIDLARRVLKMSGDSELVALRLEPGEDLGANLAVEVKETVFSNGDVTLAISNKPASGENGTTADSVYTITLFFMNVGGASSFKWELYDIDSKMPSTPQSGTDGGG